MVHLVVLCKLEEDVDEAKVEEMSRSARSQLLKIPEVLSVRAGKRIDPENEWPFFYAIDVQSMDKLAIFKDDPIQVKFAEEVIKPNTWVQVQLVYELDPGKPVKYS